MKEIIWDNKLITKYNLSGPRYTSYPTALEFNSSYNENNLITAINKYPNRDISLYVHIPFCHKLCYFCACNKIVTKNREKADIYIDFLEHEIKHRSKQFVNRKVSQLHWGGGTPTYLSVSQATRLINIIKDHFNFHENFEFSIEIDPREIELSYIDFLSSIGCNRISIGIQDFNLEVQKIINRVQNEEFITKLINRARKLNIQSINLDLIYGLPKQTKESFTETLNKVIKLSPDRLSVFNYAHIPSRFAGQVKIKESDLPSARDKLEIFSDSINILINNNYTFIGMDHFAKPHNELSILQKKGKLHRNFQGYTTHGDTDLLGLGVSSISMIGDSYSQNEKDLKAYYKLIDNQKHALVKGFELSYDDCIRRDVIKEIICNFCLDYSIIDNKYNITFEEYFKDDLNLLNDMKYDGIIYIKDRKIYISDKGKLLVRSVCMVFDIYSNIRRNSFSRII